MFPRANFIASNTACDFDQKSELQGLLAFLFGISSSKIETESLILDQSRSLSSQIALSSRFGEKKSNSIK